MEFKPFKIGKYLLLERLAMGGMAEVYRAKASGAGGFEKQLAIKRILPNYSSNEEFRRMFEYEARLSSMLTQANIVQVYDFVKSGETYLLAMEYVDGKNLRQFINKVKKIGFNLPVEYGVYIVNEVCKGLEYAHKKKDDLTGRPLNIIHRDMSPQNVMLSYEGSVKIVDFGIAKAKDRVNETRSGVIKGKFGYMSPEQANGESVDHRTDIFSTGIILYELITSRRLFSTDNDMATLKLIQECVITPPSRANPKVPPELEKLALKALTKDLSLRFQSAGLFQQALQEFLNKYFPTLTQKDVSAAMHRVFKEEIENEKKRFEQIYRQSIPFSQGAKVEQDAEDEANDERNSEDEKEDITRSESRGETGVTHDIIDEEEEENPPSLKRSSHSLSMPESEKEEDYGTVDPSERTKFGEPEDELMETPGTQREIFSADPVDESNAIGEPDSTIAELPEAPAKRQYTSLTSERTVIDEGVNASQLIEDSTHTPTVEKSKSNATATKTKKEAPKKPKRKAPTPSGLELRSIAEYAEAPESRERRTSAAQSNTMGDSNDDSSMPSLNSATLELQSNSGITQPPSPSPTPAPSYTPPPSPSPTRRAEEKKEMELAVERPHKQRKKSAFENYELENLNPDTRSSWLPVFRATLTMSLLFVLVTGTVFLYKLYFGGGFPKVVGHVVARYASSPQPKIRDSGTVSARATSAENQPPSPENSQGGQPSRVVTNQCNLNIDSDPRGASVIIEGNLSGATPLTLAMTCQKAYTISIKMDGYDPVTQNVFVKPNSERIYRTLAKIPQGTLELTITPGAMVEISELNFSRYVSAGDAVSFDLRANRPYKVHFRNDVLGINLTREFSVLEGKRISIPVTLKPGN